VRVVSLVPSVTETLLAWGVEPVAVTRFCQQPTLLAVGGTKDPDVAAIAALAPDLVVLNDEENRREDFDALEAAGLRTHTIVIRSVDDVAPELARLAGAVGVPAPSPPPLPDAGRQPARRAFVPVWRRPWVTCNHDTYASSLLARIGVANVFAGDEMRYPTTTLDEVVARQPDLVLAPSEPYPFAERHRAELETVAPVVFVDGQDLTWWGVRTPAALERLRTVLDT
jgi:ABC-type Fe3+-hydroxamate transport system substrate-binding protein